MFCYNNVLMFSPMGGKERTSVYLVGWANAWDWINLLWNKFIVIGNYLPKIKQNNTIGIRIILTLQDEENWNATHSFSGRIWRASGILCMLCTLYLIKSVSKEACIKAK